MGGRAGRALDPRGPVGMEGVGAKEVDAVAGFALL